MRRGVAKLVKALDFDSSMRGFESFLPCQTFFADSLPLKRLFAQALCVSDLRLISGTGATAPTAMSAPGCFLTVFNFDKAKLGTACKRLITTS